MGPGRRSVVFLWIVAVLVLAAKREVFPAPGAEEITMPSVNLASKYFIRDWKPERGLPQNHVSCLFQSPTTGYLWVGSWFGLARFDGDRFYVYDKANTPEMASDAIADLAEDKEGTLWIATNDGLLRFRAGRFTCLKKTNGLAGDHVSHVRVGSDGAVWCGTTEGVTRFRDGVFHSYTAADGLLGDTKGDPHPDNKIVGLLENPAGRMLVLTLGGPREFDPATERFDEARRPGAPTGHWEAALFDRQRDCLWVSTRNVVSRFDSITGWQSFPIVNDSPENYVHGMFLDRSGNLWLTGGNAGLQQWRDGKYWQCHRDATGQMIDATCVYEDYESNVWLGTEEGLVRLIPRRIQTISRLDGLPHDYVRSVSPRGDGGVWVGTRAGVGWLDNNLALFHPLAARYDAAVESLSVLETASDTLWIGKANGGLWICRGGMAWRPEDAFGLGRSADTKSVDALFEDRAGQVWISWGGSLLCGRSNGWTIHSEKDGLPRQGVLAMAEDQSGDLWFGTAGGGVVRFRDRPIKIFTTNDGLASNQVWSIHEDDDGTLWIGTAAGLSRFHAGRFFTFTKTHGLLENLVNHILADDQGHLWLSGNRGVYRMRLEELNAVADGQAARVTCVGFGEGDGMLSAETNGEHQPAGCKTPDGRLWFPTTRGVVVIDPKKTGQNQVPPPVVIEQIKANGIVVYGDDISNHTDDADLKSAGEKTRVGNSLTDTVFRFLPGGAQGLEIRYTANSLIEPNRIRFRRQLIGADAQPKEVPSDQRTVTYFNLKPGSYRFQVTACNNHSVWNETGAFFAFSIAPHFYETWPFYILCGLAVVLTAAGIQAYRLSFQKRILRLEQQHALEMERARIARDMHDDLGAGLTQLALLTELPELGGRPADRAPEGGEKLTPKVRELLRRLNELVWAVNPKNDSLENLADFLCQYAENTLAPSAIRLRLEAPTFLPDIAVSADVRHNLVSVFKEAFTNILKHSRASEVRIVLSVEGSVLRLIIEDNGIGLNAPSQAPRHPSADGGGNGLMNMKQRVEDLGGKLEVTSLNGRGTSIRIEVNLGGAGKIETRS